MSSPRTHGSDCQDVAFAHWNVRQEKDTTRKAGAHKSIADECKIYLDIHYKTRKA